jgi:hypothetical protein
VRGDLRNLPLIEKALLKKVIDGTEIQFSERLDVDGARCTPMY